MNDNCRYIGPDEMLWLDFFSVECKGIGKIPVYEQTDDSLISTITIGDIKLRVANLFYTDDRICFEELVGDDASTMLKKYLTDIFPNTKFICIDHCNMDGAERYYKCGSFNGKYYEWFILKGYADRPHGYKLLDFASFEIKGNGIGDIPVYEQPYGQGLSTITIGNIKLDVFDLHYSDDSISFMFLAPYYGTISKFYYNGYTFGPGKMFNKNRPSELTIGLSDLLPDTEFQCKAYDQLGGPGIAYKCGSFNGEYTEWDFTRPEENY